MQIDTLLWLLLPVFVAGGSALLSYYITQARADVALAKGRESLAVAEAIINLQKVTLEERIKATEESARRAAMDEFMRDLRIEERSYGRETQTTCTTKKSIITKERLYFRNIPLSNWIEHEVVVEKARTLTNRKNPAGLASVKPEGVVAIPGNGATSAVRSVRTGNRP